MRFTGGEVCGEMCGEVFREHLTIRNPHKQRVLGHFGEVLGVGGHTIIGSVTSYVGA